MDKQQVVGFPGTRDQVLEFLEKIGTERCLYYGQGPWPRRCDCKYGGPEKSYSEKSGCPELSTLYWLLKSMTSKEYETILDRRYTLGKKEMNVYVVSEIDYEYDDESYYKAGGEPIKIFENKEDIDAWCFERFKELAKTGNLYFMENMHIFEYDRRVDLDAVAKLFSKYIKVNRDWFNLPQNYRYDNWTDEDLEQLYNFIGFSAFFKVKELTLDK